MTTKKLKKITIIILGLAVLSLGWAWIKHLPERNETVTGSYYLDNNSSGGSFWNAVVREDEYWIYRDNVVIDQGSYEMQENHIYICKSSEKSDEGEICLIRTADALCYVNTKEDLVLALEKFSEESPLIGSDTGTE